MTALHLAHSPRRRRRKLTILAVISLCILLLLAYQYLAITVNILFRGPYIAAYHSDHLRISQERDGFDITFDAYSSRPSENIDRSAPVPAIMHHIMLGTNANNSTGLSLARQACIDLHPRYEFKMWTDANSAAFVKTHFPELYPMWSSYRYTIQKADSLRYMILYVYGGIFLDLDLECRRPLEPLRQFSFVAPAASPMGISNGFLMLSPQHPFLSFVLDNLPRYNINWFGLPYAIVMFSTGCHFLSTMLALYPSRSTLHILWGPNNMHQLSGAVTTPLFRHLGLSSWHSVDGAIVHLFKFGPGGHLLMIGLRVGLVIVGFWGAIWWGSTRAARKGGRRRKSLQEMHKDDDDLLV